MKKLVLLLFLFPVISFANSKDTMEEEVSSVELIKIDSQVICESNIEDDFCRICVTLDVIEPNSGSQISVTACAGNMFTSCERATEKASGKLMLEIAKMAIED